MGLVKKSQRVQVHTVTKGSQIPNHVYDGLGCLPGKHHIQLKENAVPLVHAARLVPFALREKLKTELDRLEKMGVIRCTEEPTDWVNALFMAEEPHAVFVPKIFKCVHQEGTLLFTTQIRDHC